MPEHCDNPIVKKYGQPQEIRAFMEYAKTGLEAYEKAVFARMIKNDDVVLDLGCGAGREAKAIAGTCSRVYALDLVQGMLRTARDIVPADNVYFMRADATYLPVRSSTMDVILMSKQFMNHITVLEQRRITMNEVYRVLKPGGRVYLTVHNNLFNIGIVHILNSLYKILDAKRTSRKPAQQNTGNNGSTNLSSLLAGYFILRPRSIIVNMYRRTASKIIKGYSGNEAGDWDISQVSDAFSPYKSPYHNYTFKEIASLALNAGFRIDDIRDIWELSHHRTLPKFIRKGAFIISIVLKKA